MLELSACEFSGDALVAAVARDDALLPTHL